MKIFENQNLKNALYYIKGILIYILFATLFVSVIVVLVNVWTEEGRSHLLENIYNALSVIGGLHLMLGCPYLIYETIIYLQKDKTSTGYAVLEQINFVFCAVCIVVILYWYGIHLARHFNKVDWWLIPYVVIPGFSLLHLWDKHGRYLTSEDKEAKLKQLYKLADACKDKTSALEYMDTALELNYKSSEVYTERGQILMDLEYYLEAISDYDAALKLIPNNTHSYYSRALCKSQIGDMIGAKIDYEMAIEKSKEDRYENTLLHQRAKILDESWQDATHVYESFYEVFLVEYDGILKNGLHSFLEKRYQGARKKHRE
jgi:tetratricopeptide (TPR) repeat protein